MASTKIQRNVILKLNLSDLILYEDDDLLIVNKPSGLPTQATLDPNRSNLYSYLKNCGRWSYLGLHHRLDAGTSGVVLLTKSKRANLPIGEGFKKRVITKKYRCWVMGTLKSEKILIENYLKPQKLKGRMTMKVVQSGGEFAKTELHQLQTKKIGAIRISQLEVNLHTGRMHQIRSHCLSIGNPILGDDLYVIDKVSNVNFEFFKINRLFLHAYSLRLRHPFLDSELFVEAPLPSEFLYLDSL